MQLIQEQQKINHTINLFKWFLNVSTGFEVTFKSCFSQSCTLKGIKIVMIQSVGGSSFVAVVWKVTLRFVSLRPFLLFSG